MDAGRRRGRVRTAQGPDGRRLEDDRRQHRGVGVYVRRRAVADARPGGAAEDPRGGVLRGAAPLPSHAPPEPARAPRLRHLAAGPPARPRVLPPASRGNPGQPRPVAPDAPLRLRLLVPIPHREDPRAAAPPRTDSRGDPGPVAGLPDRLQLDAFRTAPRGPSRNSALRLRPGAHERRDEVRKPEGLRRGGNRGPGGLRGAPDARRTSSSRSRS